MSNATDVFVIGGGPAGLAAAIAARQQGLRVLVADGAKPPIDKACGEVLMPDAITALAGLGISLPAADRSSLRGVRFVGSGVSAEAGFPSDTEAVSIRRTVLHRIMAERAATLGVGLLWQSVVTGIRGEEVRLGDRAIRASGIRTSAIRAHGSSEPTAPTPACAVGPILMPIRTPNFAMPFAATIVSRLGTIAWKYTGENAARDMPPR